VLTFPASLTTHLAAIYYGAGSTLAGCLNFGVHLNQSEDEIAAELVRRVRKVGMEPTVGIAASRELATLAARCGGIRIIPAGGERDFSDWLPLDLLDLAPYGAELEPTLARWGLKRFDELARFDPRQSVPGSDGMAPRW